MTSGLLGVIGQKCKV